MLLCLLMGLSCVLRMRLAGEPGKGA